MADSEYLDDYEQAEQVKKWLRENALALIVGVGGGLALLAGWQWWERHQQEQRVATAEAYNSFSESVAERQEVPADIEGTAYAGLARLQLASEAVEAGELDRAASLLEQAIAGAEPQAMQQVAGLRLARVRIAQGDAEAALALVDQHGQGSFAGLAQQIRGDAHVLAGDLDAARAAYQAALESLGPGSDRSMVQMKLDDLPEEQS